MMNFSEILETARLNNVSAYRLMVATEVDLFAESKQIEMNKSQFEIVCEFIYKWVMSTEAQAHEVVSRLFDIFEFSKCEGSDDCYTLDNFTEYLDEITELINNAF